MIYEEYYKKYLELRKTKDKINKLENKKISLMSLVDVKSATGKGIIDSSNKNTDKFLIYSSEIEQVELTLNYLKKDLIEIKKQLEEKEIELKNSQETFDKIYYYKYINRLKYSQICEKIHYEKSSFYKFLDIINKRLNELKNISSEKNGKK